ncbi:MAG: hypothetical protein FRX49_11944 [Trebouxia sp. A1-2]|nr:MAG: hypothetical protein FRX49_11944 [Trebouxia sp. A1-2]
MLLAPEDRTALQSLPLRGIVSSPGITARGGIVPSWSGEAVVNRSHNGELSLVGSEQAERHTLLHNSCCLIFRQGLVLFLQGSAAPAPVIDLTDDETQLAMRRHQAASQL